MPRPVGEARTVVSGFKWVTGERIVSAVVSFVSVAILACLLGPEEFGIVAAGLLVTALANAIFDGAFGISIMQRREIDDVYVSSAFFLAVGCGVATASIPIFFAEPITEFFQISAHAHLFKAFSLLIVFKAIDSVGLSCLKRESKYSAIAGAQVLPQTFVYAPVSISLALLDWGVWSLVLGQASSSIVTTILVMAFAKVPRGLAFSAADAKDILFRSGPLTLMQVLNWFALTGSSAVVGHSFGPFALGVYSRAWKLLDIVTQITAQPIISVLLPSFSRMQSDVPRVKRAFERSLRVALLAFGIISVLVTAHADAIVRIALGSEWGESVIVAQILFLALVPRCCYRLTETVAISIGRSWSAARRQFIYAVLMVGGALLAAPFGYMYVAITTSTAITIFYTISVLYISRAIQMSLATVLRVHVECALIAGFIGGLDVIIMAAVDPYTGYWLTHAIGMFAASCALLVLFAVSPVGILGDDVAAARSLIRNRMLRVAMRDQGR